MARYLDLASLPENVARYAQGQVAAGRFALQERDEAGLEWLAYARREAESGFAALDRDEGIRGTVDEHLARIDAAVRVAARTGT